MPLNVWSGVAHVVGSVPPPGRLDLFALKRAGDATPRLVVEVYGATSMVAAGEVAVWELNQAIAALLSESVQARRLALRDDGRRHGGHLDVVASGGDVELVATSKGGERVAFATTTEAFVGNLNALVRHYLALTRASTGSRTIVLPEQPQRSARAALTRPVP